MPGGSAACGLLAGRSVQVRKSCRWLADSNDGSEGAVIHRRAHPIAQIRRRGHRPLVVVESEEKMVEAETAPPAGA